MQWSFAFPTKGLIASTKYRAECRASPSVAQLTALAALTMALVVVDASSAIATYPERNCTSYDRLVPLLTGKPHYERQVLVLKDGMPGQGGKFELFFSRGEGGRNSYTLTRTRHGSPLTCIVSAGLVATSYVDKLKRTHLLLKDENDPDTFDIMTHNKLYVIARKFEEQGITDHLLDTYGIDVLVVSYGKILIDRRIGTNIRASPVKHHFNLIVS